MAPKTIENPFLPGFHPDPSILRVDDDYYVVTSTFEWFPGYEIHHSRDLRNWQLIRRPLDRVEQLDMAGIPDSCGVWAPCLSHHDGVFYLLYTNVRAFDGPFVDTPNFLVTATDPRGEWSDPIPLNASGFDASLFHDDDGRSWYLNMVVDHRQNRFFGGIVMQEFDREQKQPIGRVHAIFPGTELGRTEGPHLYRKDGFYYLIVAEGGTGYEHAVTVARSESITGPYELHPANPLVTAHGKPESYLQKTGHADLVETPDGDWYLVFLASRPIPGNGRCTLGRESAIERIEWREGWPWLACGGNTPRRFVEVPDLPDHAFPTPPERIEFDPAEPLRPELDSCFQSLRVPMTADWVNTTDRPGHLRLYGRESLASTFRQSLVARRLQSHSVEAATRVEFAPTNFQQMAGLVAYYNTYHYHYLYLHGDDYGGDPERKFLSIQSNDKFRIVEPISPIEVTGVERIFLKLRFVGADLRFYYATEEDCWKEVGPVLDGSILSDDYVEDFDGRFMPCFTGAFLGLACQDLSSRSDRADHSAGSALWGRGLHADFAWFEYRQLEESGS